jgi:hypothetical protein
VHDTRGQVTQRGLRLDQAAAIYHVLTSSRTVEVIVGPAGTGKTRALAAAVKAWTSAGGSGQVFGTATYENATKELRKAGVQIAANTTRLLASIKRGHIPPGSLIVVDEGSMVSFATSRLSSAMPREMAARWCSPRARHCARRSKSARDS